MTEIEIRETFSKNIAVLRKSRKLNQSELADQLHYSNKAVSKWETGETMPDVSVLKQVADFFNVTIDDLISNKEILKKKKRKSNNMFITFASAGLSFLIAALVFFILTILNINKAWISFIIAIPTSAVVLIVLTRLWFKKIYLLLSIILFIWSSVLVALCFINFRFYLEMIIFASILTILSILLVKIIKYKQGDKKI